MSVIRQLPNGKYVVGVRFQGRIRWSFPIGCTSHQVRTIARVLATSHSPKWGEAGCRCTGG